jgi:peroxiredoxin
VSARLRATAAGLGLLGLLLAALPATASDRVLRTLTGERLSLSAALARGPVVLDFWATWCRPCEQSLPALERLHRRLAARGVTVVAVSIDGPRNWARVRPHAARLGLTMPVVVDEDGSLARQHRVQAVPTSVLLGRDGRVVRVHSGFHPAEEDSLARAVEALLAPVAP